MMNDSIKLARLWTGLKEVKDRLDNEIIPVGSYLGIEDPNLMITLGRLFKKLFRYFQTLDTSKSLDEFSKNINSKGEKNSEYDSFTASNLSQTQF